ncbi:MAG: hypothetical protein DCF20_06315 [Pseudanabaena sp.]|nr:MAG: hypothetical protein DCF20_06315 [Pseudanabaena sp.]
MTLETEDNTAQKKQKVITKMPRLFKAIAWTRLLSALAILSSLAGSMLLFFIGVNNTFLAFAIFFKSSEASNSDIGELATIKLLESLDDFLVGLAFLYFAYGIYSLFIALGQVHESTPSWLRVENIGELEKSLLEILVVFLSVLFVKGMLEQIQSFAQLRWEVLIFPLSIMAIAFSIRLLSFEEKSEE